MITSLVYILLPPRRAASYIAALAGLAGFCAFSSAQATVVSVAPNDTYLIEVEAYNTTNSADNFYAIASNIQPTFGTTQTYANSALPLTPGGTNYQTLTVTSSQTITGNTTVDTITISVPTNFLPTGTTAANGDVINALEFSIGNYNVPSAGTANTLDFSSPFFNPATTGSCFINSPTTGSVSLSQNPLYSNGNKAFSDLESVQSINTATSISTNDITSFTITLSSVPEPSTYAAVLLGAAGLCWLTVARRRARA